MTTTPYKAVIFDLGGTLRIAYRQEAYERHARRKLAELSGTTLSPDAFYHLLSQRYQTYRTWALTQQAEAGDQTLWCQWLLPDYDPLRIQSLCHQLSYEFRQASGYRLLVEHGDMVLKELHARGYQLAIISNMIGETEVADWLEETGLDRYFSTVLVSACCHLRKPGAAIYRLAAQQLGLDPAQCVSVGDNPNYDLPGAMEAGITANILFESPEKKHPITPNDTQLALAVIQDMRQLLPLLPSIVEAL